LKKPSEARHINLIPPYSPGLTKDEIARKYGIEKPVKLASNENPLGPSPMAVKSMRAFIESTHLYPDPMAAELKAAASEFFGFPMENIITGNGSDEIIDFICRAYLNPGDKVVIPACTFSYYRIASLASGASIIETPMDRMRIDTNGMLSGILSGAKIAFLANPNNPTGTYTGRNELINLCEKIPSETILVLDEAYAAFARADDFMSGLKIIKERPNVVVINTLSKSHGLAGIRVGFAIAQKEIIDTLYKVKPPFNMNLLAIKAGAEALKDRDFLRLTLDTTWKGLDYLYSSFSRLGIDFINSHTNFVLLKIGPDARSIYEELLKRGLITRFISGLPEYIRVSVGLEEENRSFIHELEDILRHA
jgi:histidinol-phosphate aminotransferase